MLPTGTCRQSLHQCNMCIHFAGRCLGATDYQAGRDGRGPTAHFAYARGRRDLSPEMASLTLLLAQPGCRREMGREGFCGAYCSVGRNKVSLISNCGS